MKKIIYLLMMTGLFFSCGDNNNNVNMKEITQSDGFAMINGEKFTGTGVIIDKRKTNYVKELIYYKNGLANGYERYSRSNDSLVKEFKMKNDRVYKISKKEIEITSDLFTSYYDNGNIRQKAGVIWIDGKWNFDGKGEHFSENGKKDAEFVMNKGKEVSKKLFDENGKETKE